MAEIIYDPTRGWLLLTEKWPKESDYKIVGGLANARIGQTHEEYHEVVKLCLSTAIEIDEDDWVEIRKKSKFAFKDHHPYTVDAEFEVKEQYRSTVIEAPWYDYDVNINGPKEDQEDFEYRQIARLVKAKEYRLEQPTEGGVIGTEIGFNPTDSVTSDGTEVNYVHVPYDVTCPSCGYTGKDNEFTLSYKGPDTISICPKCGNGHVIATTTITTGFQPTESQDELWKDLIDVYDVEDRKGYGYATLIKALSARFRIERI